MKEDCTFLVTGSCWRLGLQDVLLTESCRSPSLEPRHQRIGKNEEGDDHEHGGDGSREKH